MLRFFALILLILTPSSLPLARQAPLAEQRPARVPGSRVSLTPPAGFEPAKDFPGFSLPAEGASILVTELPATPAQITAGLSDPERLKGQAMTLVSREEVSAGGAPAVLFGFRQAAARREFRKWILVVGDTSGTAMVTATFPAEAEGRLSGPLRRSVLTAGRDRSFQPPAGEGLTYDVTARGALKPATRVGNVLMYTPGGAVPNASPEDPLFFVGRSLGAAAVGDEKAFAERRLRQTAQVKNVTGLKTEPFSADGLSGFETLADAEDRATGGPLVVYQAILFDGADYYLMQGLVGRARAAEHLPAFKEMARSFRRR